MASRPPDGAHEQDNLNRAYNQPSAYGRRDFLRRSAAAAMLLGAGGVLLDACGSSSSPKAGGAGNGDSGCGQVPKLSRQDNPATLPHCGTAIKDGLTPESGTLKVLNYADYLGPDAIKAFEQQYKVKIEVTAFESMDEAVDKIQNGTTSFDITNVSPDRIASLVATSTVQPINHSYIPNLSNVWTNLQSPFYDRGSRYTVPYTVYTTGIGYRTDKIDPADDPSKLADGTDLFFKTRYKGRVWILDDDREALSMALLRLGITDVNTEDPANVRKARDELDKLIDLVGVKVGVQDYTKLPEGSAWVHQAWSGDMVNAVYGLPKGVHPDVLGYWFQPDGKGLIQNDMWAIPAKAKHPVLAHHFMNFILDPKQAFVNFGGTGYQQPLNAMDPDALIKQELIPKNLTSAVVRPSDFDHAFEELQLSPTGDRLWQSEWAKFKSGAH